MPTPTTHQDALIAAAKRDLDLARLNGDATWITTAINTLHWRLDQLEHRPLAEVDPELDMQLRVKK